MDTHLVLEHVDALYKKSTRVVNTVEGALEPNHLVVARNVEEKVKAGRGALDGCSP